MCLPFKQEESQSHHRQAVWTRPEVKEKHPDTEKLLKDEKQRWTEERGGCGEGVGGICLHVYAEYSYNGENRRSTCQCFSQKIYISKVIDMKSSLDSNNNSSNVHREI